MASNGSSIICGGMHGKLHVWDVQAPGAKPIVVRTPHASAITAIAVSDDGQIVVTGDETGHLGIFRRA